MQTRQIIQKQALHHELQMSFSAFQESKLAEFLLAHAAQLPAFKKINAAIENILISLPITLIAKINALTSAKHYLYESKLYGHLNKKESVFHDVLSILRSCESGVPEQLQIHLVFIQQIYIHLTNEEEKKHHDSVASTIFSSALFSDRGRNECKMNVDVRNEKIGINRQRYFSNKMQSTSPHQKRLREFQPNCHALFFQRMQEQGLPFVAGISGSAGAFRLGAELYGHLTVAEKKQYALMIAAFLVAAGAHSFHEVLSVFSPTWFDYQPGCYEDLLSPELFIAYQDDIKNFNHHFNRRIVC